MYVVRWALCPLGGVNLAEEEKTRVTVRLDPINEFHLDAVMNATGLNQTAVVKLGLKRVYDDLVDPCMKLGFRSIPVSEFPNGRPGDVERKDRSDAYD